MITYTKTADVTTCFHHRNLKENSYTGFGKQMNFNHKRDIQEKRVTNKTHSLAYS